LLTSMDRDGTRQGFDLALTRAVSDAVEVPVIASGGVGELSHLVDGVTIGGADAVLAASVFHFGEVTIPEGKRYMAAHGIPMRLEGRRPRPPPGPRGSRKSASTVTASSRRSPRRRAPVACSPSRG